MASNFSVVSLFKVNLNPSGGSSENEVTAGNLEKIKKLCTIAPADPTYEHINALVEREHAYIQRYESEIAPQRQERID